MSSLGCARCGCGYDVDAYADFVTGFGGYDDACDSADFCGICDCLDFSTHCGHCVRFSGFADLLTDTHRHGCQIPFLSCRRPFHTDCK